MELFRSRGEDPSSVGETLLHRIIGDPEVGHRAHGVTEVTTGLTGSAEDNHGAALGLLVEPF